MKGDPLNRTALAVIVTLALALALAALLVALSPEQHGWRVPRNHQELCSLAAAIMRDRGDPPEVDREAARLYAENHCQP